MKPKYPESKHRRIILLYALAILLPGLLLGVMAWRGIQNDQARREKEGRDRLHGINDRFCLSLDSLLLAHMNQLTQWKTAPFNTSLPQYITLAFHQVGQNDPSLIRHPLIYLPDSLNPGTIGLPDRSAGSLDSNLAEAINFRILNQPMKAIAAWTRMERRFPNEKLYGKIPVILTAVSEKAKIFGEMNQPDSVCREKILLYRLLINPPVEFEAAQYRFFKNLIAELPCKSGPESDSLSKILLARQEETDFYIRLVTERNPLYLDNNQANQNAAIGLKRFPFSRSGISYLYLTAETANTDRFGMVINTGELLRARSAAILQTLDPAGDLSWSILNGQKITILDKNIPGTNDFIHFNLNGDFPGWELLIRENKSKWIDEVLSKGTGTYLLIFLFIGLIMVLGLIFTLYTLNQELKLNRLKSDFIANVSHELKSPLTSIRHLMDLLHTNRVKTADQRKKYYATMIEQTEHLSYLIENILDFSRLEDNRKKYQVKQVDYAVLVYQCIDQLIEHARVRDIEIITHCSNDLPGITVDPDAIQQVIFNLVDNAIKFSEDSKNIEVAVSQDAHEIKTCVRDWGYGIAKKDQDKIFDRFYRCEENLFRGIKGSGIGLTLVRKIIIDHGGRITVDSAPNAGSLFCFYLPVKSHIDHEKNSGS